LLIGLLLGTVLYIIGGYFFPFIVYSCIMLLCIPFVARYIPASPIKDLENSNLSEKGSDEDIEIGEKKRPSFGEEETVTNPITYKKRKINPFKLIWRLLSNKVRI